ncbi:helix-turn-helix domain-containing protein [Clostridium sp.]|jgi:DNA-binding HxlR family transcriptional regulator|uniref:winged helix-turn-helix transcriptional regulator n=1 Tax=Clostridium sp. TaxID=1506 RepID=UPI00258EBDC6|nr:helix-turn-helix domain-containing protein [Clostridium sp.]MDF2505820.1 transcriptional regulator, HxlR family [Clostridium sp.]
MLNYKGKEFVCYLDLGFELIRGKWKAVILCNLNEGPKRFLELQRFTGNVSQKVLSEKLSELEIDGLIEKKAFSEIPPRVEYFLTERGEKLFPALDMIQQWAIENFQDNEVIE